MDVLSFYMNVSKTPIFKQLIFGVNQITFWITLLIFRVFDLSPILQNFGLG